MDNTLQYHIGQFDGPLDVLLSMISKNKIDIFDIPISFICDQYVEYIRDAGIEDMDTLGEFLVMAAELMLIKSKMLLPRPVTETEDPRARITDALLRFQQAKQVASKLSALYTVFSGRMVKDTDEISVDRTFVLDQDPMSLVNAVSKINARSRTTVKENTEVFTPMIRKPMISIDKKIRTIVHRLSKKRASTIRDLLSFEGDRPDIPEIVATFLGVLELIKTKTLIIDEEDYARSVMHGIDTKLIYNPDAEIPVIGDGKDGDMESAEDSDTEKYTETNDGSDE